MNFSWYCFNAMEQIDTTFSEKYREIPNYKVAVLDPQPYDLDVVKGGGCYGNGTYLFNSTGTIYLNYDPLGKLSSLLGYLQITLLSQILYS